MNTGILVGIVASGLMLVSGCAVVSSDVAVREPPTPQFPKGELTLVPPLPPVTKQVVDAQLNPHVWVDGRWTKTADGYNWVWIPAHRQ